MSSYSISPEGVSGVVDSVGAEIEALPELHAAVQEAGQAAVSAAGSGSVGPALSTFLADRFDSLPSLARQAGACTDAALVATAAYVAADAAMAVVADAGAQAAAGAPRFAR